MVPSCEYHKERDENKHLFSLINYLNNYNEHNIIRKLQNYSWKLREQMLIKKGG